MTNIEIDQILLEKQRARKRVNRKRFYEKNKANPEFMAKQYEYIRRHREKLKRPELYSTWVQMKQRCFNKNNKDYKWYGAKGVIVCERWLDFNKFIQDLPPRPKGTTLDRIDSNGNYEPSNCRWATWEEQWANKTRRKIRMVTIDGVTLCLSGWAKKIGINQSSIYQRIKNGWSLTEAVSTPPKCRTKRA